MQKSAIFFHSLLLSCVTIPASAAQAQGTAATEPKLAVGTMVYDSEGAEISPISRVDGANVVVTASGRAITLPASSFAMTDKGPAITITLVQLVAAVDKAAADQAAARDAAIQPGVEVHGVNGTAIIGKIKVADANGVVIATSSGDVKLPRNAFFVSPQGLATTFTAEQFALAVKEANQAAAADEAAVAAALKPGTEVRSMNGSAILGTVKSFDTANVVVTTANGDVALPLNAFNMGETGLTAAYTPEQFAAAIAQATGNAPPTGETAESD